MVAAWETGGEIAIIPVLQSHRESVRRTLEADWRSAAELFGNRLLSDAAKWHGPKEIKLEDVFENSVRNWIATWGAQKVVQITSTTEAQIKGLIMEGVEEGLGTDAIARMMRQKIPQLSQVRSHVIARTETHNAAGFGNDAAARSTGLDLDKEWISVNDDRTRDDDFDHVTPDGQTVGLHEKFVISGEEMNYPGDPSASAGNVVNCRCVAGYIESR